MKLNEAIDVLRRYCHDNVTAEALEVVLEHIEAREAFILKAKQS